LQCDPESYLRDDDHVFAYATGRSFYERLFPNSHVTLGWSSITVHWLSAVPTTLSGQIFSPLGSADERAAYAERAADDWRRFLGHRFAELVPGGQLVIVGSGADEHGRCGAEGLLELANGALREMVADGTLAGAAYERMVVPTYYRTRDEFLAPLVDPSAPANASTSGNASAPPDPSASDSASAGAFTLQECAEADLADPLWERYEQDGDVAAFAASASAFLRAFSEPSLFGAIAAEHSAQTAAKLADDFYARVREAIAAHPEQAQCAWRLVLLRLAKPGP
jgi:hypothetical protein